MPSMSNLHEGSLVEFVRKEKRERVSLLLRTGRGRAKLVAMLPHFSDWDAKCLVAIPPSEQNPHAIATLLRAKGAKHEAYLLSCSPELDANVMPLDEALRVVVGNPLGTVISCLPGRLAYFEGEYPGDRWILWRDRSGRPTGSPHTLDPPQLGLIRR